jgi:hypothetical protein
MSLDIRALSGPVRVREPAPVRPIGPVLIQVPALRTPGARTPARPSARTAMRRRRRLRKEVRIAGSALLLGTPVACALMFLFAGDPEPAGVPARLMGIEGFASADEIPRPPAPVAPVITVPRPTGAADAPVVLPAYVLPDDGSGEPTHAGG